MKTTLCVDRLEIITAIGCVDREKEKKMPLYVSLRLTGDFSKAVRSDELADAVDYISVTQDVLSYALTAKHELLESLASSLIGVCLEYEEVDHVWVKVEKEYLPHHFSAVGVEMEMKR